MRIDLDHFIEKNWEEYGVKYTPFLEKANKLIGEGRLMKALPSLCAALVLAPRNFSTINSLASFFTLAERYNLTAITTEHNLSLHNNLLEAHFSHFSALIRNNERNRAAKCLIAAAEAFADQPESLLKISENLFLVGYGVNSAKIDYGLINKFKLTEIQYIQVFSRLLIENRILPVIDEISEHCQKDKYSDRVRIVIAEANMKLSNIDIVKKILRCVDQSQLDQGIKNSLLLLNAEAELKSYRPQESIKFLRKIKLQSLKEKDQKFAWFKIIGTAYRHLGKLELAKSANEQMIKISNERTLKKIGSGNNYIENEESKYQLDEPFDIFSPNVYQNCVTLVQHNNIQIKDLKAVVSFGGLYEAESIQSIYNLGKLFAVHGSLKDALACWEFGGQQVKRKINIDIGSIIRHFLTPFKLKNPIASTLNNEIETPIFLFGLPETGIQHLINRLEYSRAYVVTNFEDGCSGVITEFFQRLENSTIDRDNIDEETDKLVVELRKDLMNNIAYKSDDGELLFDFLGYDLRTISLISAIFPEAIFLTVDRDPVETVAKMFSTLYKEAHAFSYDLGELIKFQAVYTEQLHILEKKSNAKFIKLKYQDVLCGGATLENAILKSISCEKFSSLSNEKKDLIQSTFKSSLQHEMQCPTSGFELKSLREYIPLPKQPYNNSEL